MNDKYDKAGILIRPTVKLESEMDIEQLQIRMGEMTAEIERLQSVIDEANAQEHIGTVSKVWRDSLMVDRNPNAAPLENASVNLYAHPIPAQQSPAVAVPEFNGWYCAQCQCGVDPSEVTFHETHTVCGRYIADDVPPTSPRITEQDAREILRQFYDWSCLLEWSADFDRYLNEEGRALLNKLNKVEL